MISCQYCGESDVVPVKVAIGAETFWTVVKMDQVLVEHEPRDVDLHPPRELP